jgi:hypothetical protein
MIYTRIQIGGIFMSAWNFVDLTGKKFNHLTVLKRVEDYISPSGNKATQYLCECDCQEHKQLIVRGIYLKSNHTTSCGCAKIKDIKDVRFGRLVAIERLQKQIKNGGYLWKCLCDCGNMLEVSENSLQRKQTKSCGCLARETSAKNGKKSKKYNKYDLSGEYGVGYTTNTNVEFIFDKEDYDKIKNYTWYEAYGHIVTKGTSIQKLLLNSEDKTVDHINRNPMDNRKVNLRECTQSQNSKNQSKPKNSECVFMGVSKRKNSDIYEARIGYNHKKIHLGSFNNLKDAIVARLKAEKQYFGEFAPQRDLFEQYGI